jgi:hypothetical protein
MDFRAMIQNLKRGGTMQPPIFIYALVSTRDKKPSYVGQSLDVEGRLKVHLQCLNLQPTRRDAAATFGKPVYDWIKSEVAAGFQIESRILEECPDKSTADKQETFWIAKIREAGYALHNGTNGSGRRTSAWRAKVLAEQRAQLERDRQWVANFCDKK